MIFTRTAFALLAIFLCAAIALAQQPLNGPALRTQWRFSTPAPTQAVAGARSAAIVIGDREGNLCAVSSADGKPLWAIKLPDAVSSGPGFSDSLVVIGDEAGIVHAVSIADGKLLWSTKTGGKIVGRPLITGERVLVGSYDNKVHTLNLKTGKEDWSFATGAQVHAAVVDFAGVLLTGGCDGHLRGIDAATGEQKWDLDLEGVIATTPVIAGDHAIVGTMEGVLVAVDASGKIAWRATPLKEAAAFTATPAVVDDRAVFVADDGQIASIRLSDGGDPFTGKLQGSPGANLVTFEKFALVGTDDGKVEVIDPATARVVRRITLGGSVRGLVVIDSTVIASTDEGAVWGLGVPGR